MSSPVNSKVNALNYLNKKIDSFTMQRNWVASMYIYVYYVIHVYGGYLSKDGRSINLINRRVLVETRHFNSATVKCQILAKEMLTHSETSKLRDNKLPLSNVIENIRYKDIRKVEVFEEKDSLLFLNWAYLTDDFKNKYLNA